MTAATEFRTGTRTLAELAGWLVTTDGQSDTFVKGSTTYKASYSALDFIRVVAGPKGAVIKPEMKRKMLSFRALLAKGVKAEGAIKVALAGADEPKIRKALAEVEAEQIAASQPKS